ncbi:hypothetical protein [Flexivirga meconopsidis]|uniref:hypothetical protein n=1 Tax=Flexivirga meconopsidis TaxID=2977121 RepID=UPI00223F899A|nr:hypothetical protein [Flexivirga meconopsidis]
MNATPTTAKDARRSAVPFWGLRWWVRRSTTPAHDDFGRRRSVSARVELRRAATELLGADPGAPTVDRFGRWQWPELGVHGSTSSVPGIAAVALSTVGPVGVDVQDDRQRPHTMLWARRKLGLPDAPSVERAVGLGDFSEIEAMLKAAGWVGRQPDVVPVPPWSPGWRRVSDAWWVRSTYLPALRAHVALAAGQPLPVSIEGLS